MARNVSDTYEDSTSTAQGEKRMTRNIDTDFLPDLHNYSATMTADETFTYPGGSRGIYTLDPGGADRTFTPSGTFPDGFYLNIKNIGQELITFDPSGSAQVIGPGQVLITWYDKTNEVWVQEFRIWRHHNG